MNQPAQIVIGPDGVVLAVAGDLPTGLVDTQLQDCEALSSEIRGDGQALLDQLHRSRERVVTQDLTLGDGDRGLRLVAIEALAIRRTPTDLRTLLSSKLSVLSSQASAADVTLSIGVADDVPALVDLDSEKVAWAVTTLVGNALRYVRSGRRIAGARIDVRAAFDAATSEVAIEVQDNGPGIPADTVTRLFRRDGLNVRGAGLALLLMSDICGAHGGTVDVRSSVDVSKHGTAVRLTVVTLTHVV